MRRERQVLVRSLDKRVKSKGDQHKTKSHHPNLTRLILSELADSLLAVQYI